MSYNQVELYRHNSDGNVTRTVTYIPSKLAIVGKAIQLKVGDLWNDWIIENVSIQSISDDVAQKIQRMWHGGWNNNI